MNTVVSQDTGGSSSLIDSTGSGRWSARDYESAQLTISTNQPRVGSMSGCVMLSPAGLHSQACKIKKYVGGGRQRA